MEAVVDMTPRLRISSSAGQRQRSLSPSPAPLLPPYSSPKCVTHFPPLLPFPPLTDPHVRVLTSDLWHWQAGTMTRWNIFSFSLFSFNLTPLRRHGASPGCRARRSTRPRRGGARQKRPGGRRGRRKPVLHLWSPTGLWSSAGWARTLDLWGVGGRGSIKEGAKHLTKKKQHKKLRTKLKVGKIWCLVCRKISKIREFEVV